MSLFSYLLPLFFPFLVAAFATHAVRGYALKRLLDLPNTRSSHSVPTPRGGGLGIVAALVLATIQLYGLGWVSLDWLMALAGAVPVAAVGFWDDHGHVPARWRLLAQFAAAGWALYWLGGFGELRFAGEAYALGGLGMPLGLLFIVWVLNLFNFMDGIDGIAGVETLTVGFTLAALIGLDPAPVLPGSAEVAAALAAAAGGFLLWNWPPAKIFMGDVGSGFVGFLLGVLALRTAATGGPSLAVWLIALGVFFVDATFTLLRRMADGQRWYEAHRSHAYQHAAQRYGHRPVTLAVLAINLFWLGPLAWAAARWPALEWAWLGMAYAPLLALALRFGAGLSHGTR
ncbi:Fuc2NAc and GlcNAc transferase [Methylomagnum ishizawai]|uniref:Fuc2NAc and GlcNAc transferase n=1 Tax=Methylomagnum ishizawai TaxID=1760988 RepID=A0A1Y6DCF0_9GAMM|nr:glycosyltransferase family 4 protein [Methylomagnum ishizawai]SMF97245.1 Fuc2NAc and GlcNAc transferase [Methylomagnum ishizawai]